MQKMMNEFTMKLAGIPIHVKALYPKTMDFCGDFKCDDVATLEVKIDLSDIAYERNHAKGSAAQYNDEYLETLAVYRKIAEVLPTYGVLLIHGSALSLDEKGYLFVADSGVGKSTHAALWRDMFGERVKMINDDKPLLKVDGNRVLVCGTPWMGKHRLGSCISAPLYGVCFLHQSSENSYRSVDARIGFERLLSHCYRPASRIQMVKTLNLLDKIAKTTSLGDLYCNVSALAVQTAIDGMGGVR